MMGVFVRIALWASTVLGELRLVVLVALSLDTPPHPRDPHHAMCARLVIPALVHLA